VSLARLGTILQLRPLCLGVPSAHQTGSKRLSGGTRVRGGRGFGRPPVPFGQSTWTILFSPAGDEPQNLLFSFGRSKEKTVVLSTPSASVLQVETNSKSPWDRPLRGRPSKWPRRDAPGVGDSAGKGGCVSRCARAPTPTATAGGTPVERPVCPKILIDAARTTRQPYPSGESSPNTV
jgi:hypothetical protein